MKAMDVGLGIYTLGREPDGSYEFRCIKCGHPVDLDSKGDPHARWSGKGGHVTLAETCPNPL